MISGSLDQPKYIRARGDSGSDSPSLGPLELECWRTRQSETGPAATVGEESNLEFKFQLVTVKKAARLEGVRTWTLPKREEQ